VQAKLATPAPARCPSQANFRGAPFSPAARRSFFATRPAFGEARAVGTAVGITLTVGQRGLDAGFASQGRGPLPKLKRGWLVYVVTLTVAFVVFYAMVAVALWYFHARSA